MKKYCIWLFLSEHLVISIIKTKKKKKSNPHRAKNYFTINCLGYFLSLHKWTCVLPYCYSSFFLFCKMSMLHGVFVHCQKITFLLPKPCFVSLSQSCHSLYTLSIYSVLMTIWHGCFLYFKHFCSAR